MYFKPLSPAAAGVSPLEKGRTLFFIAFLGVFDTIQGMSNKVEEGSSENLLGIIDLAFRAKEGKLTEKEKDSKSPLISGIIKHSQN